MIKQERYALEALLRDPLPWFERAELRVSKLDNTSGERLGATRANDYDFESTQAELLLSHQRVGPLSGMLGFSHQSRDVTGLYYLLVDRGQTKRTVNALTRRIAVSVALILLVIVSIYMGWIKPHGIGG